MISFKSYLNESVNRTYEVNLINDSREFKNKFLSEASDAGLSVSFGKNNYATTASISGNQHDIIKFLKEYEYTEDEWSII